MFNYNFEDIPQMVSNATKITLSSFFLMAALQICRAIKDITALRCDLNTMHWLMLLVVACSWFIPFTFKLMGVKNKLLAYSIVLVFALYFGIQKGVSTTIASLCYVLTSSSLLLMISQYWIRCIPLVQQGSVSMQYSKTVLMGMLGSLLGPFLILISFHQHYLLLSFVVFFLLVVNYLTYKKQPTDAQPISHSTLSILSIKGNKTLFYMATFILLYASTATFLYFFQLEAVARTHQNQLLIFGIRDGIVAIVTIVVYLQMKHLNLKTPVSWSALPFISLFLFVLVGFLPQLTIIIGSIVFFRAGNFIFTKPQKELQYYKNPSLIPYRPYLDASIYRLGDLLGVCMFTTLKYFKGNQAGMAFMMLPLVLLWYVISRQIDIFNKQV